MKIIKKVDKSELRNFMYDKFQDAADDPKLYECLNSGRAINVFQMSAGTASQVVNQVHPNNLLEMTACNSMARPGTIDSLPDYVEGKSGHPKYKNEIINSIFGETFGVCLYQEQIMRIVELLSPKKEKVVFTFEDGGKKEFDPDEKINTSNGIKAAKDVTSDDGFLKIEKIQTNELVYNGNYARGLLKRLGKANKKQEDIDAWNKMTADLQKNSYSLGIPSNEVKILINDMITLANYSFNKSHALAYSMMAAWTLYLNVYFSKYYFPAVIEYAFAHDKETLDTLKDVRKNGFIIHEPNINTSKARTFSDGNDIFIGLHNLKQVGSAADIICEKSPYKNFSEFLYKNLEESKVNKRVYTALVEYGCFDSLDTEISRKQMIACFNHFWDNKPVFKKLTQAEVEKIKSNPEIKEILISALKEKINSVVNYWEEIKNDVISRGIFIKDTREMRKEYEEKYLGFNFFVSPFEQDISSFINSKIALGKCVSGFNDIRKFKDVSKVVPVYISSVREYTDKNGNLMAFLSLEDRDGNEAVVPIFASVYQYISSKISPNFIVFMLMYNTDDSFHGGQQLMFGTKKKVSQEKYSSFIIPLKRGD